MERQPSAWHWSSPQRPAASTIASSPAPTPPYKLGEPGPIRGVFSALDGNGDVPTWTVVFTVTFDTADYTYKGTAEGSLDEGELSGEVEDASGDRRFMFRGKHREGKFHAVHAETTGGFVTPTGEMTLSAESLPVPAPEPDTRLAATQRTLTGTYDSTYQNRPSRIRGASASASPGLRRSGSCRPPPSPIR